MDEYKRTGFGFFPRRLWSVGLGVAAFVAWANNAAAVPRTYRLLVMRVDFSDAPGVYYTQDDFRDKWVQGCVDYYTEMSNGQLSLVPTVLNEVIRLQERRRYYDGHVNGENCKQKLCGDESVTKYDTDGYCCFNAAREATDIALSQGLILSTDAGLAALGG